MRIATTYQDGNIFAHFGHTEQFKMYDVRDNCVIESKIVDTNGSGHGALAGFLKSNDVDVLICGGIGGGAINALQEVGIKVYGGLSGNADEQVTAYLEGELTFNPNPTCSHHHEHSQVHTCRNHGCGTHGCHH